MSARSAPIGAPVEMAPREDPLGGPRARWPAGPLLATTPGARAPSPLAEQFDDLLGQLGGPERFGEIRNPVFDDLRRHFSEEQIVELTGGGVDYSFEAIGLKVTPAQCWRMLKVGGTATIIGMIPNIIIALSMVINSGVICV